MEKKRCLAMFGVMIMVFSAMVLLTYRVSMAAQTSLVRIIDVDKRTDEPKAIRLEPKDLKIQKDGIVVWSNEAYFTDAKVVFNDGKRCSDVLGNTAKDFDIDSRSCFVTTYMPWGSTSSLSFPQTGKFEYMVESKDGKFKAKGTITVTE